MATQTHTRINVKCEPGLSRFLTAHQHN